MWVKPQFADALEDTILELSCRRPTRQFIGLGQCIKTVQRGKFFEIDFCSKWSHSTDGTISNWHMCRDPMKILQEKQYFTGQNEVMLREPWIHRFACLLSLMADGLSRLLEDYLRIQLRKLKRPSLNDSEILEKASSFDSLRYRTA